MSAGALLRVEEQLAQPRSAPAGHQGKGITPDDVTFALNLTAAVAQTAALISAVSVVGVEWAPVFEGIATTASFGAGSIEIGEGHFETGASDIAIAGLGVVSLAELARLSNLRDVKDAGAARAALNAELQAQSSEELSEILATDEIEASNASAAAATSRLNRLIVRARREALRIERFDAGHTNLTTLIGS